VRRLGEDPPLGSRPVAGAQSETASAEWSRVATSPQLGSHSAAPASGQSGAEVRVRAREGSLDGDQLEAALGNGPDKLSLAA